MAKDWTYDILKYLYDNYHKGPYTIPLNDFLISNFGLKPDNLDDIKTIDHALAGLNDKFIWYTHEKSRPSQKERDFTTNVGSPAHTPEFFQGDLNSWTLKAKLIHNGYIYISERIRNERLNEIIKLQAQSVIDTNASVTETNDSIVSLNTDVLPRSFRSQERFSNWSLMLSAFSIIFIGISAYLQWKDQTPTAVRELKQQVQETSKALKQIELSQKEINSSMKKLSDSLTKHLK